MPKTTWFQHGVEAFQLARPGAPKCYPCPICLRGFRSPRGLSRDDVPPRSQRGSKIVLTCRECNSRAGHELEADIPPAETLYAFASGTMAEPIHGQVTIDGLTMNADILAAESGITIAGLSELNDPATERAVTEKMQERSTEGSWRDLEIKLSFGRHDPKDALVGWLRAGYLAVFAAWGFGYILRPQLDAVRKQIMHPSEDVIRVFTMTMQRATHEEPHISLIEEPESLRGHLAVMMGRHVVYLPGLYGDDLYDELAGQSEAGLEATVSAKKEVPWPERPRYELDFALSGNN